MTELAHGSWIWFNASRGDYLTAIRLTEQHITQAEFAIEEEIAEAEEDGIELPEDPEPGSPRDVLKRLREAKQLLIKECRREHGGARGFFLGG